MRVEVAPPGELGPRAASHVAAAARAAVAARGRFAVAFSGGSTPGPMLEALAVLSLPWEQVHVFQADERIAPDGHPDRNLTLLRARLLERAPIPRGNAHAMPVADRDPEDAAGRYAATLQRICGDPAVLDLVHLGLGADGHTASLVPGDPALDVTDRDVAVTGPYQGRRRMTLTAPCLERARGLLFLVAGGDKAAAVRRLVDGDPAIPAGRLDRSRALLVADPAAAAPLPAT